MRAFSKNNCKGQSLTEFIILMPFFFVLLFGIFEMAYLYRAKATLNTATFDAARAGSLDHARLNTMRSALVKGMLAQYVRGDKSFPGIIKAMTLANGIELGMKTFLPSVTIVSPTKEIFNRFKKKRWLKLNASDKKEKQIYILPNDNLNLRSTVAKKIKVAGKNQKINIQDANLLKIKTYWCYDMKVPIVKDLIYKIVSGGVFFGKASKEQRACNKLGFITGMFSDAKYIAISSSAVVRMQSAVFMEKDNLK